MKPHSPARRRALSSIAFIAVAAAMSHGALAQDKYDTGASDTEIKIGNTSPYSGPVSAYSVIGQTEAAYFKMLNEKGGINGRKVTFLSYDDGASPPKSVEQVRKLVESDGVLLVFGSVGTAPNAATQKYLNGRKVPQLFIATGASRFGDPQTFPWTMALNPTYYSEGKAHAKYILESYADSKIAILLQNDDAGKDYLKGLKDRLGEKSSSIVAVEAYESTEPTVDSQIIKLKASGAQVFLNVASPKFAAQAIKRVAELGWKPVQFIFSVSISIGAVMEPAGFDNSQGIISTAYLMDPNDSKWKDHPDMKEWSSFMDRYMPGASRSDSNYVYGYVAAQALAQVLTQSGDKLTRENVMKEAANLRDVRLRMMLPNITINTSSTDYSPFQQFQMMRIKGKQWELFGDVIDAR